jgi:hypothetical protein
MLLLKQLPAETATKNHNYHYTTPSKTVICDSDDMTDDHVLLLFF